MGRLDGKVVLISGGARGQGAVEARMMAQEGAKVVIGDILDDLGKQVEAELAEAGLDVTYVHLDVTIEDDWTSAVSRRGFGLWSPRYAGEQRRHSDPQGHRGHHGGGLGPDYGHQRQGSVPWHQGRNPRNARGRRRVHRQHLVHRRVGGSPEVPRATPPPRAPFGC